MVLAESPSLQPRVQRFEVLAIQAIQAIQAMRAEPRDAVLPDIGAVTVEASRSSVHVRPTFLPPRFRERHAMPDLHHRLHFGAAYYPEYQTEKRLEWDLDHMLEAGFTVIRVGESVWSTWEPENGVFDLEWLQPVLDAAHARGLSVILGTPTYAVPPWLARLYPEINGNVPAAARWDGALAKRLTTATRRSASTRSESAARFSLDTRDTQRSSVSRSTTNLAAELFHNHAVFQRFTDHLRQKFGTVEQLNEEWGTVYWSHRLATWADLWTPDGNNQPQYELEWRRFQAQLTTEFIEWQAGLVREYASPDHFVTTCLAYDRAAMDDLALASVLDVTVGNAYYAVQDGLLLPEERERTQTWMTDGTWALYLSADRMYSSRQEPFMVFETNASSIGMHWDNRPAYDGQWRQAAWALVSARSASMMDCGTGTRSRSAPRPTGAESSHTPVNRVGPTGRSPNSGLISRLRAT